MYQAYRSCRVLLRSGWRKSTIALLEPGDWTVTVHVVPSAAVKVRMGSWEIGSSQPFRDRYRRAARTRRVRGPLRLGESRRSAKLVKMSFGRPRAGPRTVRA